MTGFALAHLTVLNPPPPDMVRAAAVALRVRQAAERLLVTEPAYSSPL